MRSAATAKSAWFPAATEKPDMSRVSSVTQASDNSHIKGVLDLMRSTFQSVRLE
jgi:hypothetical protein